jgi:hypothetical protein
MGSSVPAGISALARSTFSRTLISAWSISTPVSSSMMTVARPWLEIDLISLTPSSPWSSVSTGRASRRSASWAEMP